MNLAECERIETGESISRLWKALVTLEQRLERLENAVRTEFAREFEKIRDGLLEHPTNNRTEKAE